MSQLVNVRPNEAGAGDRKAQNSAADHGMRLLGAIGAAALEPQSPTDAWAFSTSEALGTGSAVEPLQDVLGSLTEIIRAEGSPAERQPDHPFADDHGFTLDQEELAGLPGVVLNTFDVDGPVWLAVEALAATESPAIDDDLKTWVEPSSDPDRRPSQHESILVTVDEIEKNRLTFARHARPEDFSPAPALGAWTGRLRLEQRPDLVQRIERYISGPWTVWADTERMRRRTMAIHQQLRDMAAAIRADQAMEVLWGIALSSWRQGGREFELPLFERAVEIEIIARPDAEVRVRPRFVGATVNLRALDAVAPDAALAVRDRSDRLVEVLEQRAELSPFTPIGLDQILSAAGVQSGHKPSRNPVPSDGAPAMEAAEATLTSGRWAISARRRPESLALRDIDCLKNAIVHAPQSECCLSEAVSALLSQPDGRGHANLRRHLSSVVGGPIDLAPAPKPAAIEQGDLFFPLPAVVEDVEIVRELSRSDGLMVQSVARDDRITALANVVCHHLALGSRVLVVSRDEAALSLLHQKLPPAIRELTVSSTGSDKDVLRKAEALAGRLQSILDATNLRDHVGQIGRLERDIISKRTQIASLDDEIAEIVGRNLRLGGGLPELPFDLFDALIGEQAIHAWFTDRPKRLLAATDPLVTAVDKAREARLRLATDLKHIDDELPELAALPDTAAILRLHAELQHQAGLTSDAGRDEDLALDAIATFGLDATTRLAADLDALVAGHRAIAEETWLARLSPLGAAKADAPAGLDKVVGWARDASFQLSRSAEFARRQVQAPVEAFTRKDAIRVVERLAAGEKPFARFSPSRRALKAAVEAITVDGAAPSKPADWQYVGRFLLWRHDLHALRARWTSIAAQIDAPALQLESARTFDDLEHIVKSVEAAIVTAALAVRNVADACCKLSMPDGEVRAMLADAQRLAAFGAAIRTVMTRVSGPLVELARLGELFARAGELAVSVQDDVLSRVGDAETEPEELETRWTGILATMEKIREASADYELVRTACRMATAAGAPSLAQRLRSAPAAGEAKDAATLAEWVAAWNWAVLMRIESAEERQLLHDLAAQRARLETRSLALFEAVIGARMSLGIAQNAGGAVRQAVKRFRDSMQKMASACSGPTARRLRFAARRSLDGWLEEIPCHVMPAWRVAELLPARIGTFDLLVIDHASRSDLRELTAMLRARKVLISDELHDDGAVVEAGRNDTVVKRTETNTQRRVPPALRRLLMPGASLRDLAEILFPDRRIELRARPAGVGAASVPAPLLPADTSRPADVPAAELPRPARAPAPKQRPQPRQVITTHSLEEEIATVAKYLSMARRSGTDIVTAAAAKPSAPAIPQRAESRAAAPKPSPEVRVLRRRPPREPAADMVTPVVTPAPPELPAVAQPATAEQTQPRAAAVTEAPVIVADRFAVPQRPAEKKVVTAEIEAESTSAAPAEPVKPGVVATPAAAAASATTESAAAAAAPAAAATSAAPATEIKIHPSLVEMAFKSTENAAAPRRRRPSRRVMAFAAAGLLAVVGAAVSWERASEWIQLSLSGATAASDLPSEPGAHKVNAERITPEAKPVVVAAAEEHATVGMSVPVSTPAQAFLYHEDPQDPKGKRYPGKVTWSIEQSKGPRLDAAPAIKGEIEIENGTKATISLRRNADMEMPASHVMELKFDWPDQSVSGLNSLRGIGLKGEEAERGTALVTQTARVTPKYFMVALSANEVDTKRNLMLLKGKQWFDIPIVYEGGNRALLSIEKGSDGDRVFKDVFASWGQ
ncbi:MULTISPECIES: AAA family ATPase [unclassified Bradyrhizobium]|uniref:AAA family ATPase n=1 Tax=unclassified Bradyrhizobium TaxID=2631580 RepID=UPI0028E692C8|nr:MULTISPECIES: AAA family ATPase [unclassified Bradyrhizobium]